MKILLPVDLSEASLNAARYAIHLCKQYAGSRLKLMHSFDPDEDDLDAEGIDEIKAQKKIRLQEFQNVLFNLAPVSIDAEVQVAAFADAVAIALDNNDIDMVVIGVNETGEAKKQYVENHAMMVVELERCPVLIIPPHVSYNPIENIAVAVRLEDAATHLPFSSLSETVKLFGANLHVVSINPEYYIELTEEQRAERNKIAELLGVPAEFSFLRLYDVDEALELFTRDRNVQILITVPDSGGIFGLRPSSSHTARLSYESKIPVLAIPSNLG